MKSSEPGGVPYSSLMRRRELAGVAELLVDVGVERLGDLLGADAVERGRVGHVRHHGLHLHPVRALEEREDLGPFASLAGARMPAETLRFSVLFAMGATIAKNSK